MPSRTQKFFNIGKALERLERVGALGFCSAAASTVPWDIVDGDVETTLHLLWSIIDRFTLPSLLDREALARETEDVISATDKWRPAGLIVDRSKLLPPLKMPNVAGLRESWGGGNDSDGNKSVGGRETSNRELLSALLAWCQAVCHGFCVPVNSFTTSFADGRALCLLVHYYHPWVSERATT